MAQRRTDRSTDPRSGVPAWADANVQGGFKKQDFARRRGVSSPAINRRMGQTQGGSVAPSALARSSDVHLVGPDADIDCF